MTMASEWPQSEISAIILNDLYYLSELRGITGSVRVIFDQEQELLALLVDSPFENKEFLELVFLKNLKSEL